MSKRMIGLALLLAAACVAATAQAGNERAARKQIESSLLLKGTITIARDGSVMAHTLDSTDALGDALAKFVDASIDKWHFAPVEVGGKVVNAKVLMSLRLIANQGADGKMTVRIANTHFGSSADGPASGDVRSTELAPPKYPETALRSGGKGTVYLIAQVGRDGAVMNVDAEQVNLRVVGSERDMALMRKLFTDAAVRAARRWTFTPPTTGVSANEDSWLVRIPVTFVIGDKGTKVPTQAGWDSYVPGPRNMDMPWAREQLKMAGSPDALPEGGVYPLRQSVNLLPTPAT